MKCCLSIFSSDSSMVNVAVSGEADGTSVMKFTAGGGVGVDSEQGAGSVAGVHVSDIGSI